MCRQHISLQHTIMNYIRARIGPMLAALVQFWHVYESMSLFKHYSFLYNVPAKLMSTESHLMLWHWHLPSPVSWLIICTRKHGKPVLHFPGLRLSGMIHTFNTTKTVPNDPPCHTTINPLRLSDTYLCQKIRPSLVQVMACHLLGAKPSSEPMLTNCQLESWEYTAVNF